MTAHDPKVRQAAVCEMCDDEPFYPRCPECGAVPLDWLNDLCREPLRQIAADMVTKSAEPLVEVELLAGAPGLAVGGVKPLPRDPYAFQARVMDALMADIADPKATRDGSFPRLDALREVSIKTKDKR